MAKFSGLLFFGLFISVALAIKIIKYEKEEEKQDFSKIPGISLKKILNVNRKILHVLT